MTTFNPNARFHCEWPQGYGDAKPVDVDPSFFSADIGYEPEIIAEIAALDVGQTYVNYGGAAHEKHTVTRLPDALQ